MSITLAGNMGTDAEHLAIDFPVVTANSSGKIPFWDIYNETVEHFRTVKKLAEDEARRFAPYYWRFVYELHPDIQFVGYWEEFDRMPRPVVRQLRGRKLKGRPLFVNYCGKRCIVSHLYPTRDVCPENRFGIGDTIPPNVRLAELSLAYADQFCFAKTP